VLALPYILVIERQRSEKAPEFLFSGEYNPDGRASITLSLSGSTIPA
jgi:hypothetical protein